MKDYLRGMKIKFDPLRRFVKIKSLGSISMLVATVGALAVANSNFYSLYQELLELEFTIGFSEFHISKSILEWINDGLMSIFFFVIGLEIKREFLLGELNSFKKAILPVFAAVGGMIVPITIFFILNYGKEGIEGWGIPMATDIAFTLGILGIFGKRLPFGLKIFLTTFAIIDDLGAVVIITFFYSTLIYWHLVAIAGILLCLLYYLSYKNFYSKYLFIPVGIIIWILFLESGIHPTISGVLFAFSIPSHSKKNLFEVIQGGKVALNELSKLVGEKRVVFNQHKAAINILDNFTSEIQSPLQQFQNKLQGMVSFIIVPLFAFANAGISFLGDGHSITSLSLNIAISLLVGKVIGISLFSYLSVRFKMAVLPLNVGFNQIIGLGFLGGLGFTMSIFISNLSYQSADLINSSKIGILIGSFVASIIGYLVINYSLKKSNIAQMGSSNPGEK
jgi:NhaA family Na+:H+ antiporter